MKYKKHEEVFPLSLQDQVTKLCMFALIHSYVRELDVNNLHPFNVTHSEKSTC